MARERQRDASGVEAKHDASTRRAQAFGGKKGANSRKKKHHERDNIGYDDEPRRGVVRYNSESDSDDFEPSQGKRLNNKTVEQNSRYSEDEYSDDDVREDDGGDFVPTKEELRNAGRSSMGGRGMTSQEELDAEYEYEHGERERRARGGRIGGRVAGKRASNADEVRSGDKRRRR